MSASTEYDSQAQQDYGPTSTTNVIEPLLDSKLANNMSVPTSVISVAPSSKPFIHKVHNDSAVKLSNNSKMLQTLPSKYTKSSDTMLCKEATYSITNINEKKRDCKMPVGALSGLVRIEETSHQSLNRISYPLIQELDDSSESYVNTKSTDMLLTTPIETPLIQNITKLPQNFTLNMEAGVSNIATIQNVTQAHTGTNQTLWLPTTILATNSNASDTIDSENTQNNLSQIIITGGSDSYISHNLSSPTSVVTKRTNFYENNLVNRPIGSKVQILSNITIPKSRESSDSQIYGSPNHKYQLSSNATNITQKHTVKSSILNSKPIRSQSLITSTTCAVTSNQNQLVKSSVTYTNSLHKGYPTSKQLNKVNNGANIVSSSSYDAVGSSCHVMSRVVPGPKLSVHAGRKSTNTFTSSKTMKPVPNSSLTNSNKNQSRPIKIIQQMNLSSHKPESKSWGGQSNHSNVCADTNRTVLSQKGQYLAKSSTGAVNFNKVSTKPEQRLVLHSSSGHMIVPSSTAQNANNKTHTHQGNFRYLQNYISPEGNQLSNVTHLSANQHLTAQILQSLSQPKMIVHSSSVMSEPTINNTSIKYDSDFEQLPSLNWNHKRKQIQGDPSILCEADEVVEHEDQSASNAERLQYPFQALQIVLLDHTYAVSVQAATSSNNVIVTNASTALSSAPIDTPKSPTKCITSSPISLPSTVISTEVIQAHSAPVLPIQSTIPMTINSNHPTFAYKCALGAPIEDDAASVLSSLDGQKPPGDRGSDTETAPEGEEEGKTRCICDFTHDDGYMICCDRCGEWQHVDCMGIDRQNIPDVYMCDRCQPRPVDRRKARIIQLRKREELSALVPSDTDSSDGLMHPLGLRRKRLLTVTTYSNSSAPKLPSYNRVLPSQPPVPPLPNVVNKRGPKRPRKSDIMRKGQKRKIPDKRVKRKKDLITKTKYNLNSGQNQPVVWNDSYELAMTNHYSPELRAKIGRYSNKLGTFPSMSSAITAHHCTTVPHAGGQILIATKELRENTPVIELRGKYMLSTQHRPQLQITGRASCQKPGPFLFFYRLPKDNMQICIDTRTYGNEARFVRRSCKPNAELQHCIIKGALHVYLVTVNMVPSNTEITIGFDTTTSKQQCACGNPKHCKLNGISNMASRKLHQSISETYPLREKRPRNRRSSSSSPASPPGQIYPSISNNQNLKLLSPKFEKRSPIKIETGLLSPPPKLELKSECVNVDSIKKDLMMSFNILPRESEKIMELNQIASIEEPVEEKLEPKEEKLELDEPLQKLEEEAFAEPEEPVVLKAEIKEEMISKSEVIPLKVAMSPNNETQFKTTELLAKVEDVPIIPENVQQVPPNVQQVPPNVQQIPQNVQQVPPNDQQVPLNVQQVPPNVQQVPPIIQQVLPNFQQTPAQTVKCIKNNNHSVTTVQTCMEDKAEPPKEERIDDSSDGQCHITTTNRDRKKMTREERKMEAIMKAFERMERAQQKKQEVRERHTKRRESDPIQPTGDRDGDLDDEASQSATKKRRRRKGRARTTSQNANSNRRRLNSADSDMVTSGDEVNSQTSPVPLQVSSESEQHAIPSSIANISLDVSHRVPHMVSQDVGLSSACLLVEAAVGKLESAFKLPKTKKSIASEWLGKSPERSYDISPSLMYNISTETAISTGFTSAKPSLMHPRSLESLVRVASTMIGDLSGGTMSVGTSPEKNYYNSQSEVLSYSSAPQYEAQSPVKVTESSNLSCDIQSPMKSPLKTPVKRNNRNVIKEGAQPKVQKKIRRGLKGVIEDRSQANKRTLRSTVPCTSTTEAKVVDPPICGEVGSSDITTTSAPILQPPQHSAKKRWLRQAISEESDSPTAESPPNEIVTPLKKRRMARESLSCDQSSNVQMDETMNISNMNSPIKSPIKVDTPIKGRILKLDFSSDSYEPINYHCDNIDSGAGSYEHSMDGKFVPGAEYLDINLKNAHDSHKFKLDISRIIGVPGSEDNNYGVDLFDKEETKLAPTPSENVDIQVQSELNKNENNVTNSNNNNVIYPIPPEHKIDISNNNNDESNSETPLNLKTSIESQMDSKCESLSVNHSNDTSGNSSPNINEMDDIQKKIHSFHTENIQILKIRNKKPPKEKRKKVNLNFDLCMLDDQTVSVKLMTEPEVSENNSTDVNGEVYDESTLNIPLPAEPAPPKLQEDYATLKENSVEKLEDDSKSISAEDSRQQTEKSETDDNVTIVSIDAIPLPEPSTIPLPPEDSEKPIEPYTFSSRFSSTGLFSGLFSSTLGTCTDEMTSNIAPDMNVIKSAIDRTTSLENNVFTEKSNITPADEMRNVQEILSRVNQMDSHNSLLLSDVLKESDNSSKTDSNITSPTKSFSRSNDPRLNPAPIEKPKPIRRKLSITEYRKRHSMQTSMDGSGNVDSKSKESSEGIRSPRHSLDSSSGSSCSFSRASPPRLSDDAADDIDTRLEKQLEESLPEQISNIGMDLCDEKKGLFDAQPTQVEKQRENLSERLRREFGLSLPEDEEARSATALQESSAEPEPRPAAPSGGTEPQEFCPPPLPPPRLPRFHR